MKILVIQESQAASKTLLQILQRAGYGIDVMSDLGQIASRSTRHACNLVIIDLTKSPLVGLNSIRALRSAGIVAPTLVLSSQIGTQERVELFDSGADDHLTKPYHNAELLARVRALLRRPPSIADDSVIRHGPIAFDEVTEEIWINGRSFIARRREKQVLGLLVRAQGKLLTRDAVGKALKISIFTSVNALEATVHRLRKALIEQDTGLEIETLRGVGYVLIFK